MSRRAADDRLERARYTPTARCLAARSPGRSSGTRISLLCVAAQDRVLAELTDPDGRSVVLLARIWENKITRDHPELRDHLDQVVGTVAEPDHAEPDPRAPATPLLPAPSKPEPLATGGRKL